MTITRFSISISLILFVHLQTLAILNASISITHNDSHSHFLQDVLEAISVRQRWDLKQLRVLKLDVGELRFGIAKRYEFRVRMGNDYFFFRFSDEVDSWRKLKNGVFDFGAVVDKVSSLSVLDDFKVEGPFELRVDGEDELSLSLPLNTTLSGVKRVLVGGGITMEVRNAREVSLLHVSSDPSISANGTYVLNTESSEYWPFRHSSCLSLRSIHILGSASIVAYKTRNPDACIKYTLSKDTVELLPEKCYNNHIYNNHACLVDSLSLRVSQLEKILRTIMGDQMNQNGWLGPLKAKVKASTIIHFQLELERGIGNNDRHETSLAEWRTKPTVERVSFDVMFRVEASRLKPLTIKKREPFIVADSAAWSSIMSNISFTNFPSVLVPPEALTLDVRW